MPVLKMVPRSPLPKDAFFVSKAAIPGTLEKLKVVQVGKMIIIVWKDVMITHDGANIVDDVVSLVQCMRIAKDWTEARALMTDWFLSRKDK